jgi:hypothetical protein
MAQSTAPAPRDQFVTVRDRLAGGRVSPSSRWGIATIGTKTYAKPAKCRRERGSRFASFL